MKQLSWKLILPLTIISFFLFTKWWFVKTVDGFDVKLTGFPLPYVCAGWHTSLSLQIFVSELFINLLTYFAFWFILTYIINSFIKRIRLHMAITTVFLIVSAIILTGLILIANNPDNIYSMKRQFDIEIIKTEYKFVWGNQN